MLRRTQAILSLEALDEIVEAANCHYPNETGGVLMGWWVPDTPQVFIKSVIGPGPDAIHAVHNFYPDNEWQTDRIAETYTASGRRTTYLGDWHTHPGGQPIPSRLDKRTLRTISEEPEALCPAPLMIITAGAESWRLGAWSLEPAPGRLPRLRSVRRLPLAFR